MKRGQSSLFRLQPLIAPLMSQSSSSIDRAQLGRRRIELLRWQNRPVAGCPQGREPDCRHSALFPPGCQPMGNSLPGSAWLGARPSAGLVADGLNTGLVAGSAEIDHGDRRFVVQRDRIGVNPVANLVLQDFPFLILRKARYFRSSSSSSDVSSSMPNVGSRPSRAASFFGAG